MQAQAGIQHRECPRVSEEAEDFRSVIAPRKSEEGVLGGAVQVGSSQPVTPGSCLGWGWGRKETGGRIQSLLHCSVIPSHWLHLPPAPLEGSDIEAPGSRWAGPSRGE